MMENVIGVNLIEHNCPGEKLVAMGSSRSFSIRNLLCNKLEAATI